MRTGKMAFEQSHYRNSLTQSSTINSRAIACPTMSELITKLDDFEGLDWRVELISNVPSYYILQSVKAGSKKPEVQLWIRKNPFQITAVRPVKNSRIVEKFSMPSTIDEAIGAQLDLQPMQGVEKAVIWKTKPKPLKYVSRGSATILSVETPATAHYMGFGEQGGRNLFKSNTFMNYFSELSKNSYNDTILIISHKILTT